MLYIIITTYFYLNRPYHENNAERFKYECIFWRDNRTLNMFHKPCAW